MRPPRPGADLGIAAPFDLRQVVRILPRTSVTAAHGSVIHGDLSRGPLHFVVPPGASAGNIRGLVRSSGLRRSRSSKTPSLAAFHQAKEIRRKLLRTCILQKRELFCHEV